MFRRLVTGGFIAPAYNVTIRRAPAFLLVVGLVLACGSVPAAAITVDQIVALSKAGISEAVILALLERDQTILTIDPEQIPALKRQGLSDSLIVAMLQNGRDAAEAAARAVSESQVASILANPTISSITPGPNVVIVGHGPDRPNTAYRGGFNSFSSYSRGVTVFPKSDVFDTYIPPYVAPYVAPLPALKRGFNTHQFDRGYRDGRILCLAQVNTARGQGPSYVTECPAAMQPDRR